jgi:hypothetical protein
MSASDNDNVLDFPCGQVESIEESYPLVQEKDPINLAAENLIIDNAENTSAEIPTAINSTTIPNSFQEMLYNMFASVKGEISSLRSELKSYMKEEISSLQSKVEESLSTLQNNVRSEINNLRTNVREEMASFREDIRVEHETMRKRFEKEFQEMSNGVKESFGKEVAKSSRVVQSVRDEMQREIVGAKTAFEELSSDVNSKLEQHVNESKSITTDLTSKMMQDREEIDEQLTKLNNEVKVVKGDLIGITKEWKGEHEKHRSICKQNVQQINSEISNLRNKLSGYPTAVCCVNTSRPADSNNGVPVNEIHETTETSSHANTVETVNSNSKIVCSSVVGVLVEVVVITLIMLHVLIV